MTQGKEEEAEKALRRLRDKNIAQHQFQAELNEIRASTRLQMEQQKKKQKFFEMWRGTNLRRSLLSIAVICFHCANGEPPHPRRSNGSLNSDRLILDQYLHDLFPANCRCHQRFRLLRDGHLYGPNWCLDQLSIHSIHRSTPRASGRCCGMRPCSIGIRSCLVCSSGYSAYRKSCCGVHLSFHFLLRGLR
jgi:hypothetical protein